jgi:FkbM family methyltransferase
LSSLSAIAVLLVAAAAALSCGSAQFNANEAVDTRNKDFAGRAPLKTKAEIDRERSAVQDQVLAEYRQCPNCFVKKHKVRERSYLFDAVADCDTAIRVGRLNDGGKWVCSPQMLPQPAIVYSFGVGEDISFDTDMAGLFGSQVYMFDPTPSVVAHFGQPTWEKGCGSGRIHYEALGVGPVSSPDGLELEGKKLPMQTVADIARSHNHPRIDILKMDIEGGEYTVLKQVLQTHALAALNVQQVLIEFHFWDNHAFMDFVGLVDGLKQQGYMLFRKEFNASSNADKCAEYAFLKAAPPPAANP